MIPSDLPVVRIAHTDGARAVIALDGGHVISWTPAGSSADRLFVSERAAYGFGRAIRGGIPVIFPQFGSFGPLSQHGFARMRRWTVVEDADAGPNQARLMLRDDEETRSLWPHAFTLELIAAVHTNVLTVTMLVHNRGDAACSFTAALHPYFAVLNAYECRVEGLQGCRYRDALQDGHLFDETTSSLSIVGPLDRIYYDAPNRLAIQDGSRRLEITKDGFPEAVVWNPGVEGVTSRTDFAPDDQHRMLCVEAAAIQHPIVLAPGASWTGTQVMTAS